MDKLNIALDGSEIVKGVNDAVTALAELQAAIKAFVANSPKGQIQAQMQAVATSALQSVEAAGAAFGKISSLLAKGMADTERQAKESGRRVSKAFAEGLSEGDAAVATARQQRQRLQAEYERMVAMGARVKEVALANLKAAGVTLYPDDQARLAAARAAHNQHMTMVQARARAEAEASAASQKAWLEDLAGYQNMLRLRVNAERLAAAEIEAIRLQTLAGAARAQVTGAMGAPAGVFSSLAARNFGTVVNPADIEAMNAAKRAAAALREEQRNLAVRSHEVHSAFRGVAGAAGMLFLTYGSLIPLVASFTLAAGVREAIKDYKDLEFQLKFVQAVADDTSVTLKDMMASVTASAKAVGAAPVEAAEGLRLLAQAGLTTNEALAALPGVMRLSIVGELGMAAAAETATGAVNAFGLGVDNINRVVDVFFKSAAISNTSVAKISESMKQASTIAERYKVSVEDVGTALVALARRNITGSSAGTAITQMFEELATPRGEGRKVASMLGITLFDPMKHDTKEFFERFVPELRAKLSQFDPASQTFILNRITNNRGAKALSAILGLSDAELAELKQKLQESTGAAARAVIELNDSVQGDLNKLKAAFTETLSGAGAGGADNLRAAIQQLQEVVGGAAVRDALAGLVDSFTTLLQLVTMVAKGWSEIYSLGEQISNSTVGKMISKFNEFINPVERVNKALRELGALQSDTKPGEISVSSINKQIAKEQEYQRTLQDSINKLREKLSLQAPSAPNPNQDALLAAQKRVQDAQERLDTVAATRSNAGLGIGNFLTNRRRGAAQDELDAALKDYNALVDADTKRLKAIQESRRKQEELDALQRQVAEREQKRREQPVGTRHFSMPDRNASGAANSAYTELRREMDLAAAARRQLAAAEDEDARHREAMLKDSYERGVITYRSYQTQLEEIQRASSQRRLQDLDVERAALEQTRPALEAAMGKARAAGSHADIKKATNDYEQFRQKVAAVEQQMERLNNKEAERLSDSLTKALAPGVEIVRNAEREQALLRLNVDQELAKMEAKSSGVQLSEREVFVQTEILRVTNSQVDALKKYESAYKKMLEEGVFDDLSNPEVLAAWNNLRGAIAQAKQDLADTSARVGAAASEAFDQQRVQDFARSLNTGVVDALMDAGEEGGRGVRRTLEEELMRKPFRMVLQAILQPVSNGIAQAVMGGVNQFTGGGSILGTLFGGGSGGVPPNPYIPTMGGMNPMNIVGMGSQFIGGSALTTGLGGIANALGFTNFAAGLTGSAAASVAAGAPMAAAGTAGAAMGSAVATALPYIGWAVALSSLLGGIGKGETRSGGTYGWSPSGDVTFRHGPSGGEINGGEVRSAISTTTNVINDMLAQLGSTARLASFHGALETSGKGRGGVMSGGRLSTGARFGESGQGSNYAGTYYETHSTQSPNAQQAAQLFAEDLKQSTLQALQAADVPGILGKYLRSLGDVEKLTGGALDKALERIQKALAEKQTLQARWDEMTLTAEEKLAKQRKEELKAVDASNRLLMLRVHAMEDEVTAQGKAKAKMEELKGVVASVVDDIKGFLDRLNATPEGLLTPQEQLTNAREQFQRELVKAKGGDRTALQNITSYADQLIAAQTRFSASGVATQDLIAMVKAELGGLSSTISSEEYLANAIGEGASMVDLTLKELMARADANAKMLYDVWAAKNPNEVNPQPAPAPARPPAPKKSSYPSDMAWWRAAREYDARYGTNIAGPMPVGSGGWGNQGGHPNSYADGGFHSGGWRLVGEEGPELEFTGPSRIYSHQQSMQMMAATSGGERDEALLQEVRLLREEIRGLRAVSAEAGRRQVEVQREIRDNTADSAQATRNLASRSSEKRSLV